jgi:ribosomal protein S18 acetylase RimI-like enzyme
MPDAKEVKSYRLAVPDDEAGILEVFEEVAPEVPTSVLPQTGDLVRRYVGSRQSWVAVDGERRIVGYVLAEPHDSQTLSLVYLGVSNAARGQRVCSTLISKLQAIGAPIITDVRSDNKSEMVKRFEHLGFVRIPAVFSGTTKLRWEPSASKGLANG